MRRRCSTTGERRWRRNARRRWRKRAEPRSTSAPISRKRLLADVPIELRAEARIERVEQYFDALQEPERDALVHQLADGQALTVVTAVPVPPPTAELWTERLRRKLGADIAVDFAVRPEIIAGAELHFPDAILRFTWQSALAAARSELGAHADAH